MVATIALAALPAGTPVVDDAYDRGITRFRVIRTDADGTIILVAENDANRVRRVHAFYRGCLARLSA
jgi:hypothetical protein